MLLQEFQLTLLRSLPFRQALERIDVPADQTRQGDVAVLGAQERCRVFKLDFTCPSLLFGGRTTGERLRLLMDEALAMMQADLGCVPE